MTRDIANRIARPVPIILSLVALAIALSSVAAGVQRGADEGWQAHLWQLLMSAQLPFIAAFAVTADWRHPHRPLTFIALYAGAIGAALTPVVIAGL